jgi:hypothetical protein
VRAARAASPRPAPPRTASAPSSDLSVAWTTITGRPPHGSDDFLSGPADRSGIVAVEILQLGGDVLAYPFARHSQGVLFVQVLLQDVEDRGAFDAPVRGVWRGPAPVLVRLPTRRSMIVPRRVLLAGIPRACMRRGASLFGVTRCSEANARSRDDNWTPTPL